MKSEHSTILSVVLIVLLIIIAALGYQKYSGSAIAPIRTGNSSQNQVLPNATTTTAGPLDTGTDEPEKETPQTRTVRIALLDTSGAGTGPSRGCDAVTFVTRTIPYTQTPLSAALAELFKMNDEKVDGNMHFIARTNETLAFDRVTLENGVASVYVTGTLSGLAGVCDDPRAAIQIEETAKQFSSVQTVDIYLNGVKGALVPSQKGEN